MDESMIKLLSLFPLLIVTPSLISKQKVDSASKYEFFWQEFDQRFMSMHREMEEMFGKMCATFEQEQALRIISKPKIEERDGNLIYHITLPHIDAQSLTVSIDDNILKITASQIKEVKNDKENIPNKISKKQFQLIRSLPYSINVKSTKAEYENGILIITMHKEKPQNSVAVTIK